MFSCPKIAGGGRHHNFSKLFEIKGHEVFRVDTAGSTSDSDSAARNGVCCGVAASRWATPPLRTTGCLKKHKPIRALPLDLLGPSKFVPEPSP